MCPCKRLVFKWLINNLFNNNMKKKAMYFAPATRWTNVFAEDNFLTSLNTGGVIEPGQEDDWGTLNSDNN